MPRLRNIVTSVATYLQNPDGSNGQICDRATYESWGVTTPNVIAMRTPLHDAVGGWNLADEDTEDIIEKPAANVPVPSIQAAPPPVETGTK